MGGLFGRAGAQFTVVSAGTGAISDKGMRYTIGLGKVVVVLVVIVSAGTGSMSGKGMRDTIGLGKGVVVLVVIVGVQGSFGLGCGEFVGLTASCLFLGIFIETGGFGVIIWGSPTCNRFSRTLNRDKRLLCSACRAECSCSTCASRVSRSLTLTRRATCELW